MTVLSSKSKSVCVSGAPVRKNWWSDYVCMSCEHTYDNERCIFTWRLPRTPAVVVGYTVVRRGEPVEK